jgi:hypothetical protein
MRRSLIIICAVSSFSAIAQTELLNTDFQTGMPVNYTVVDNDGLSPNSAVAEFTSAWITLEDPEYPGDQVAASTSFFEPIGTADRWMITPAITLGAFGNFVEWSARSQDASYPDDYLVLVSNTDAQLSSFTDTIGYVNEENFEWTTRTVDLSDEGYDGQTIYIAFVNVTENGYKLYIDDIRVWKDDPAGINEQTLISAKVYPNPFSDTFTIETSEEAEITVFNSNGRMIVATHDKTIDLRSYPNGVYYVNVNTSTGVKTIKAVKI